MSDKLTLSMRLAAAAFSDFSREVQAHFDALLFVARRRIKGETDCPYPHDTTNILAGYACPACKATI